jgi:predicted dinucleotide-binding enzyme
MKVGFIGLGHMGAGMAANLVKAGHDVTVYNRTRTKVEALVAQGAKAAASVAPCLPCWQATMPSRASYSVTVASSADCPQGRRIFLRTVGKA